jgi:hypothetical protein
VQNKQPVIASYHINSSALVRVVMYHGTHFAYENTILSQDHTTMMMFATESTNQIQQTSQVYYLSFKYSPT